MMFCYCLFGQKEACPVVRSIRQVRERLMRFLFARCLRDTLHVPDGCACRNRRCCSSFRPSRPTSTYTTCAPTFQPTGHISFASHSLFPCWRYLESLLRPEIPLVSRERQCLSSPFRLYGSFVCLPPSYVFLCIMPHLFLYSFDSIFASRDPGDPGQSFYHSVRRRNMASAQARVPLNTPPFSR